MDNKNWDFDTFLAFLLIYASYVDMEFSDEEKSEVKKIVSAKKFKKLHDYFKELSDYQVLEVILSYKEKYFSTENEKENLFKEMRKLFNADGDYSTLEKELLMFLGKLM